jgi:hypothetical protein
MTDIRRVNPSIFLSPLIDGFVWKIHVKLMNVSNEWQ